MAIALGLGLLQAGCSRPPEHLSAELVAELIDRRLERPAEIAGIVSKRMVASLRAGEGRRTATERQLGLLGIDRFACSGSVGSGLFAGSVTAGWAWVSQEESSAPEHSSARGAAVWIAEALAKGTEKRLDVAGLSSALRALRIPDGQRWEARVLGGPGRQVLLLETVPVDRVPAGGPVPWVLLAFRGETPDGDAEVGRLGAAVVVEAGAHPEAFVYVSGAEAFLRPTPVAVEPQRIAEVLPVPPSLEARVDGAEVTFEAYDDVPDRLVGSENILIPRRRRLIRAFLSSSGELVGASAEIVSESPGEWFLGGWYRAGDSHLQRRWRGFLENHLRKGTSTWSAEPLRCAWPDFLPWPRWFEEPAELPVHVGKSERYDRPVWGAGGGSPGKGLRYSWFSLDEDGTVRYCIHQTSPEPRRALWGSGFHPGFEAKLYAGFLPPRKEVGPQVGRENVPFYDGVFVEDATGALKLVPGILPMQTGPLFLEEFEPILLRVISPTKPDSRRPWGDFLK